MNTKKTLIKSACVVALLSASLGTIATTVHATETGQAKIENSKQTTIDKDNPGYKEIAGTKPGITDEITDIKTQSDLDNIVKEKGSDLTGITLRFQNTENLVFPAGVYKFTIYTHWSFPQSSKGNIDFSKAVFALDHNAEFAWTYNGDHATNGKNQEISGVTVYGTPDSFIIDKNGKKADDINLFRNHLFNAQHITFKDWTAKAAGQHGTLFNIEGSQNITVDNLSSQGVGREAYTKASREALNTAKDIDKDFATAIKIVNIDKFENKGNLTKEWKGVFVELKTDKLASENITITNSTFKGYEGKTGHSIIDNADDKISLPFSGNIKSEKSDLPYKNIVISNNKLDHTIDFGDKQNASVDPIALYLGGKTTARDDIKVTGNQITNYEGPKTGLGTIKDNGNYITWTVSDETPKPAETPKPVEPPKVETPKVEAPKPVEPPKVETPKSEEPKAETPKSSEVKPSETPKSSETPKVEEPKVETPKSSEVKPSETPKSSETKPEVKPDVKPETKPSTLEPKSEPKSEPSSAPQSSQSSAKPVQTPAKQDLPKTNDVKVPLTISGIVLATAGFVTLGYRKFFGKN